MVVPWMCADDFIKYLTDRGVEIVSNDYFDDYKRIIMSKDGKAFPFQYREVYYYPIVVRICRDLGIDPPEQHLRNQEQYEELLNRKKKKKIKKDPS
jgi:hypothetical protein